MMGNEVYDMGYVRLSLLDVHYHVGSRCLYNRLRRVMGVSTMNNMLVHEMCLMDMVDRYHEFATRKLMIRVCHVR